MSRTRVCSSSSNRVTGAVGVCITGVPHRVIGSTVPPVIRSSILMPALAIRRAVAGRHHTRPDAWRLAPDWWSGDAEPMAALWLTPTWSIPGADAGVRTPDRMTCAVGGLSSHHALSAERNLSAHTVRAYAGDLTNLFSHLARVGEEDLGAVDIRTLRRWLAVQHAAHLERATLQRRAACVRTFFAWAVRTGRLTRDPAVGLRSPRVDRRLPPTLEVDQARDGAGRTGRQVDEPPRGPRRSPRHAVTWRSWRCCTPAGSGSPNCAASISTDLDRDRERSACWARAARSGPCRWGAPALARS